MKTKKMKEGFSTYKDARGKHRWRLVENGRITGASTQGYSKRKLAIENARGLGVTLRSLDLAK
jgi:uncharacterized protein YegP (UPF0339 family)